jgi:hypothetical protein
VECRKLHPADVAANRRLDAVARVASGAAPQLVIRQNVSRMPERQGETMTKKTRSLGASLLAALCAAALGISDPTTPRSNAPLSWAKAATMSKPDLRNNKLAGRAADVAAPACGTGCKLFTNAARLSPASVAFPAAIADHAETTFVIWNGQYLMYYRTFISPAGTTCTIPQGVAMATSADAGATWTPVNGGRPLPALQTVQDGQSCTFDDSVQSTWVYAPDVIADGSRLVMAFEQRDHDLNYSGPGNARSLHSVRYVTSTDGRNWSNSMPILLPGAVGAWDDEVGTPDIEKDGTGYILTFHGNDSTKRLKQTRALVHLNALAGEYTGERQKVILSPPPPWVMYGVGKAQMTREQDGNWYIVFEAFSGASGQCGRMDTRSYIGIARSADALTWSVRQSPLISGGDALSCGWDMPSWQLLGRIRGIVTPNDPPEGKGLVRWDIVDR